MNVLERWVGGTKALTLNPAAEPERLGDGSVFYRSSSYLSEEAPDGFEQYATQMYKANPIVFRCVEARRQPFSEARFQVQEIVDGRPGRLSNVPSLDLLSNPWPNGTTGELLSRMEQDAALAGNFYATTNQLGHVRRLSPSYVRIVSGVPNVDNSQHRIDARVLAYVYQPPDGTTIVLTPEQVVHYSPIPDPLAQWRGMSWLTPAVREIQADDYATTHKLNWYRNGAQTSLALKYDSSLTREQFEDAVTAFRQAHEGPENAYKTLHVAGGADPTVISTELRNDFKTIQGAGETRIAAAAGVGAIIGGLSEGLQGSSLNAGNYTAAKRQFADMTLRPLWRTAAAALSKLVVVPAGSRLWYDARDVEFLKDDRKDAAEILSTTATTIRTLVDAGYTPESVAVAVEAGDLTRLEHSGLYSVQLQAAGAIAPTTGGTP